MLEASAGTGKTSVLVARYVNLLKRGVDPANILAITFTRKAAAEMRERIVRELGEAAERSELDRSRWIELRDRLGDIAISTIDAFCLSLLREFPLEADLDPGFDMADETEVPRLIEDALDQALRILTSQARTDPDVALVFAQLGIARTREGLASLLERRLVAWAALDRFLAKGPADLTAERVCRESADRLRAVLGARAGRPARGSSPTARSRTSATSCWSGRLQRLPELGQRGKRRVPRRARPRRRALPDRRRPAAQRRRHQPLSRASLSVGRRGQAPSCRASSRSRRASRTSSLPSTAT